MKNNVRLMVLILILLIVILESCEPNYEQGIDSQNAQITSSKESKIITSKDVPDIMRFLESNSNSKLEFQIESGANKSHEEDIIISSVLADQIRQVTNSQGKSSYTFELIEDGDKHGIYFMNLVVKEYADELYLFIMKYVPDNDWLKSYKSDHDFASFSGMIYYYDSEGLYLGSGTMYNGRSIATTNQRNCDDGNDSNTELGGQGGGPTDNGMPDNGNGTGGGYYTIEVSVYHTIPTGETFEFVAGSVCQHPGECEVTVVVLFIWNENENRSVRDLIDCPAPTECYDGNGEPCALGCDENGNCIEEPEDVESIESGVMIGTELSRLANQLNNLVGPDNYEFFIPDSDEETLHFDSFDEFEEFYDMIQNEIESSDIELISDDGQTRTHSFKLPIDNILNTELLVQVQTEMPEPNSEECMQVLNVLSYLTGNTSIIAWNPNEFYDVYINEYIERIRVAFEGQLVVGFNIEDYPFKISLNKYVHVDYHYTTGEPLNAVILAD